MPEQRYAILIGNSSFPQEPGLAELRCPEQDVEAVEAILSDPALGGFTQTLVFKNQPSHHHLIPQGFCPAARSSHPEHRVAGPLQCQYPGPLQWREVAGTTVVATGTTGVGSARRH